MHLTLIQLPTQSNPTHPTLKQAESVMDKGTEQGGLAAKSRGGNRGPTVMTLPARRRRGSLGVSAINVLVGAAGSKKWTEGCV